jgi:hypothetical protein
MKNPLSYTQPQMFYGFEINEWCRDQINHGTVRAREARRLLRKNYKDDRIYVLEWTCRNSGVNSSMMIVFRRYDK